MADNSPILIGRDNSANPGAQTLLRRAANSTSTDPVFTVRTPVGASPSGIGVFGNSPSGWGVLGTSPRDTGRGTGVMGFGGRAGVAGSSDTGAGMDGESTSGFGVAGNSGIGIGVYGRCFNPDPLLNHVGGYFDGGIKVVNGLKPFTIDHPLDPQNRYLVHTSVESSEMKNVYDGVARLDKDGGAWVDLPEWFEALNGDFRYQLTAVGGAMPNLHVAEEVSENRFKIAGGQEGMKVCWQLTGTRKDPWAAANPFEVEQEKPQEERGRYLEPGLYDAPEEQRVMMEPPRAEAVEEKQRPPEPSSIDFARLDPDSASLCTSTGFVYGSLEVPIVRQ